MRAAMSKPVHLWMRSEARATEQRTALLPEGVAQLRRAGLRVTVEDSANRVVPTDAYAAAGADIVASGAWRQAPRDAFVLGLKELPDDDKPLGHQHIFFGHAFKGQKAAPQLLRRFAEGGGTLLDLEYLTDEAGRRVAAFGYWAGYVGAALSALAYVEVMRQQKLAKVCPDISATALLARTQVALNEIGATRPVALIVGAKGRVGQGAVAFLTAVGVPCTLWDMAETASGGPFPDILRHDVFLNCVLAGPQTPVFVRPEEVYAPSRRLKIIGDIACDPDSAYNPIPLYSQATSWSEPVHRVAQAPILDIMAIDNLPSLLPQESSEDFATQLLPHLLALPDASNPVWRRAAEVFQQNLEKNGNNWRI